MSHPLKGRVKHLTRAESSYRLTIHDNTDGDILAVSTGRTEREAFEHIAGNVHPEDMLYQRWLGGLRKAAANRRVLCAPGGRAFHHDPYADFSVEIERLT